MSLAQDEIQGDDHMRNSMLTLCLLLGATAVQTQAQTPATAPPAATSMSTSLGMVVFPAKGQTPQTQSQDEATCYVWSKGQTGVDPIAPAQPAEKPPTQPAQPAADGSRLKGAARGAAAGAIIGEVADNDAGKGAAIGATTGIVAGGRQGRENRELAQQQQQQAAQQQAAHQQAAQQQQIELFKKGFAACLEPKGYTVK